MVIFFNGGRLKQFTPQLKRPPYICKLNMNLEHNIGLLSKKDYHISLLFANWFMGNEVEGKKGQPFAAKEK